VKNTLIVYKGVAVITLPTDSTIEEEEISQLKNWLKE